MPRFLPTARRPYAGKVFTPPPSEPMFSRRPSTAMMRSFLAVGRTAPAVPEERAGSESGGKLPLERRRLAGVA